MSRAWYIVGGLALAVIVTCQIPAIMAWNEEMVRRSREKCFHEWDAFLLPSEGRVKVVAHYGDGVFGVESPATQERKSIRNFDWGVIPVIGDVWIVEPDGRVGNIRLRFVRRLVDEEFPSQK